MIHKKVRNNMADIELVIKIPEETYNDIQSRDWKNGELIFSEEWKAIHNGTPLPKGHGDLIYRNIVGYPCVSEWKIEGLNTTVGHILSMQPTIIEADTEGKT